MPQVSAGLLMYRKRQGVLEVLLVHPGGPFFRSKDRGAWTIPKGQVEPGEDPLATARREFKEETGIDPCEPFIPLGQIKQKGGKVVHAWAFEGDCDLGQVKSNTFTIEWPPGTKRLQTFPEIDRAEFFEVEQAKTKINPAQASLLEELVRGTKD